MAKINPRSLDRFVSADYAKFKAVLFYGSNIGRVHELVDEVSRNFFNGEASNKIVLRYQDVAREPHLLLNEISSLDLFGNRKVIAISDSSGAMPAVLEKILVSHAGTNVLIIFYGGQIVAKDRVRKLFEDAQDLACVACYLEEAPGIEAKIRVRLRDAGVQVKDASVIQYVAQNIGGDSAFIASEVDKLIGVLKVRPDLSLDDVKNVIGRAGDADVDKYIACLVEGKFLLAEVELEKLVRSGVKVFVIVRALSRYFMQVYTAHALIADGVPESDVPAKLKPPIFFKAVPTFKAVLKKYSSKQAVDLLEQLLLLEINVKTADSGTAQTIFERRMLELFVIGHKLVDNRA